MSDTATTDAGSTTKEEGVEQEQSTAAATEQQEKDWRAEYERAVAESRKHEERAKSNYAAAQELKKLKASSMSETERAVAEARAAGESEAIDRLSKRLVDAEVRAAVAGRKVDVDALLDGLDRKRFLTDAGEPDVEAINAWVNRLAPKVAADMGQGARGSTKPTDMNSLIRSRMR